MPIGTPLSERQTHVNALLYGAAGVGKTSAVLRLTRLCQGDQMVFLINAEAGAKAEALVQRDIDPARIDSWPPEGETITYEGLEDALDQLEAALQKDPGCYVGVVFDSGTEIARALLTQVMNDSVARDTRLGKTRSKFNAHLEDYGVASAMQRDLLRRFRDLPAHMMWTALERRDIDDDGKVTYGPAMSPAVANDTMGLVDVIGYCMVEEVGGETVRSAHFVPVSRRKAKDRFGLLPAKMADPFADRIIGYVRGEITADNDPVQKHVRDLARGVKPAPVLTTGETADAAS